MANTANTQPVITPATHSFELEDYGFDSETLAFVEAYLDAMQQWADDGEPTAMHWLATGGPERYLMEVAQA